MLNDVELTQTHSNILILQPDPQIYDVSYKDVKNLEKKFKEGGSLRVRCVCASFLCRYHALTLMYASSLFYIVKLQISGYLYM